MTLKVGQAVIIRILEEGVCQRLLDAFVERLEPLTFRVATTGSYWHKKFQLSQCEFIALGRMEPKIYWFCRHTIPDPQGLGQKLDLRLVAISALCEVTAWEILFRSQGAKIGDADCDLPTFKQHFHIEATTSNMDTEGVLIIHDCSLVAPFWIADSEPCYTIENMKLR